MTSPAAPSRPALIVVDASVALKWLLPEPHSSAALALLRGGLPLHAPDLLFPEVGNILWKRVRAGEITAEKAGELLAWLDTLPLTLHPTPPLLRAALEIACQHDRTVYDSLYLALAVREGGPVVTADTRLVNALASTPLASSVRLVGTL